VLCIVFTARRKQRMIPVIAPKRNTSLDFIRTVGDLYYETGDHADLVRKKILYFREHIRACYHYDIEQFSVDAAHRLSQRSGKPREQIAQLFSTICDVDTAEPVSAAQLTALQRHLDIFHERND